MLHPWNYSIKCGLWSGDIRLWLGYIVSEVQQSCLVWDGRLQRSVSGWDDLSCHRRWGPSLFVHHVRKALQRDTTLSHQVCWDFYNSITVTLFYSAGSSDSMCNNCFQIGPIVSFSCYLLLIFILIVPQWQVNKQICMGSYVDFICCNIR